MEYSSNNLAHNPAVSSCALTRGVHYLLLSADLMGILPAKPLDLLCAVLLRGSALLSSAAPSEPSLS